MPDPQTICVRLTAWYVSRAVSESHKASLPIPYRMWSGLLHRLRMIKTLLCMIDCRWVRCQKRNRLGRIHRRTASHSHKEIHLFFYCNARCHSHGLHRRILFDLIKNHIGLPVCLQCLFNCCKRTIPSQSWLCFLMLLTLHRFPKHNRCQKIPSSAYTISCFFSFMRCTSL